MFHQLLQRSAVDFDAYYAQINDMVDNRKSFESNLEVKVRNFANRFVSQEKTIRVMTEQLVELEKRAAKSERRMKSLEKSVEILKTSTLPVVPTVIPVVPTVIPVVPTVIPVVPTVIPKEGFYCEFCENSKLGKVRKRYYERDDVILTLYYCPKCGLEFKFDDAGNSVPVARNKGTLERAEQRRESD